MYSGMRLKSVRLSNLFFLGGNPGMTVHEVVKAYESNRLVWYIDNDGEDHLAAIESLDSDGYAVIVTGAGKRVRVSPDEIEPYDKFDE